MGKEAIEGVVSVVSILAGVAIIATLVSKNAATANVISAGGSALATSLNAATLPVTAVGSQFGAFGFSGGVPVDYPSF
jgi:PRD1 phage membrane DNA delivery